MRVLARSLGTATLAPLVLLLATGLLLSLAYVPDPVAGPAGLAARDAEPGWRLVRSLHAWSADATLLLALLHAARVLLERSGKGPRRWDHVHGVVLLGLVALGAITGPILRWDAQGRTLALGLLHALQPLGGAARILALGDSADHDRSLLDRLWLFHAVVVGLALALLAPVHAARGLRTEPEPNTAPAQRVRRGAALGALLLAPFLLLAAAFPPALDRADPRAPWPLAAGHHLADATHTVWAPLAVALLAVALLASQPWIRNDAARRAGLLVLGAVAAASVLVPGG